MSKAKYISKLVDASGSTTSANVSYTGTLTGSTGILNIGSGQVYKDASGNVGIGTSNPATKLTVAVSGAPTTAQATYVGDVQLNRTAITSLQQVGGLEFKASEYGSGYGAKITGLDDGGLVFGNRSNSATWLPRMTIDSSGNVGIGLAGSTANSKLSVYGPTGIASGATGEATGVGSIRIENGSSSLASDGGLEFKIAGDTNGYGAKIQALNSGGSQLVFANRNASATWIERMRIDSAGTLVLNQGQIKFPSTQVASANANTLDDYEEGTWTPVPSAGITFAGTASYTANYTKIGRLVTANLVIYGQPTVHQWDTITLPFPIFGSTAGIANMLGNDFVGSSVAWASWSSNLLVFNTTKTIDVNGLHMFVIYNTTT